MPRPSALSGEPRRESVIPSILSLDAVTQETQIGASCQRLGNVRRLNLRWMTFHLCTRSWSASNPLQGSPSTKRFLSSWRTSLERHAVRVNLNQSPPRFKSRKTQILVTQSLPVTLNGTPYLSTERKTWFASYHPWMKMMLKVSNSTKQER